VNNQDGYHAGKGRRKKLKRKKKKLNSVWYPPEKGQTIGNPKAQTSAGRKVNVGGWKKLMRILANAQFKNEVILREGPSF